MLGGEQRGVNGAPDAVSPLGGLRAEACCGTLPCWICWVSRSCPMSMERLATGAHCGRPRRVRFCLKGWPFFVRVTDSVDGCMHYGSEPNDCCRTKMAQQQQFDSKMPRGPPVVYASFDEARNVAPILV